MAVSAFRSSTRRSCQISSAEASVPSTPRSTRGSHRRSSSLTDFGLKYSDYSSNSEYRSHSKSMVKRGGRSSVDPSDYESGMDCISVHQRQRRRDADSKDERVTIVNTQHEGLRRKSCSQNLIQHESSDMDCISVYQRQRRRDADSEDEKSDMDGISVHQRQRRRDADSEDERVTIVNTQHEGLRRKSSSQNLIQHESKLPHLTHYNDIEGDDTEENVEEKTSLRMDPPVGTFGTPDVLDVMKSEVRCAVAEIRAELEESMRKNCNGSLAESQGTDVIQAVADIRKEYSARLEQSEKRVRELWSQLAIEERRCLELSKIVKELLPTPSSSDPRSFTVHGTANRKKSHKRRNSAEKQLVFTSLDDEALKYFEECVSISPLDCQEDLDDSSYNIDQQMESSKDGSSRQITRGKEMLTMASNEDTAEDTANMLDEDGKLKSCLVGSDGVFLPWLQWESEADLSDKHLKKLGKRRISPKGRSSLFNRVNSGSNNPFYSSSHGKVNMPKESTSSVQGMGHVSNTALLTTVSGGESDKLMCERDSDNPVSILHASLSSRFSFIAVDERKAQKAHHLPDLDTLMLERIRFKCRIEHGELIVCQDLFW